MIVPRNPFLRLLYARPRVFIAAAVTIFIGIFLPQEVARHSVTRWLIAWNSGTVLYVLLASAMMIRSRERHMQSRAQLQDDGQLVLLALVAVTTVASLAAIASELTAVKDAHGFLKSAHAALAGMTVLCSWAFIQVMFTLHYAHDYYAALCKGEPPGLQFPDSSPPDYGTSFILQPSSVRRDKRLTSLSHPSRCAASGHCIAFWRITLTPQCLRC